MPFLQNESKLGWLAIRPYCRLFTVYFPKYFKAFFPAIRPEFSAKAEDSPEAPLIA
jgi:hypothetical protein